jgi:hypothetical protein
MALKANLKAKRDTKNMADGVFNRRVEESIMKQIISW